MTYNVKDFGAIPDGKTLNTKSVQSAIDKCSLNGGGIVRFDGGRYVLSTVFLRSNVTLEISENTEILGAESFYDYAPHEKIEYPLYQDASHSYFHTAMFVGIDCENIRITGKGKIDILDAQGNNGWMPYSAPNIGGAGGYWWSNVITSLPLKLYAFTGDKSLLEKSLTPALRYLDFCNGIHSGDFIIRKSFIRWYLGEWLNPDPTTLDVDFMNTLAYYAAVDNVSKICELLGEEEKKQELTALKEKIKEAVNLRFYDKSKKQYAGGEQGANLLPLYYGFLTGEEYEVARKEFIEKYKKDKQFDTGIILTPVLLEALTKWGETDLCYELFTATGTPSFREMLQGETTLCEHWNKKWPGDTRESGELVGADVSHCHPMFGSVVSWMYKYIAGLDLSKLCDNQVVIAPKFTAQIQSASASKETKYGKVSVEYCAENSFEMKVVVPYGLTCLVVLNEGGRALFTVNGREYPTAVDEDGNCLITLHAGAYLIR